MREITDNIKQTIEQKEIFWAYPIALKLQKSCYHLAIQWSGECIQLYLSEFKPNKLSKLNKYIQQALDSQNDLTPLQCNEMSQKIWYLPGREEAQTAIARLWWSIRTFKAGEDLGGIREAGVAVELVLPDVSNHCLLDRYLEIAIRIHEEYESQNE